MLFCSAHSRHDPLALAEPPSPSITSCPSGPRKNSKSCRRSRRLVLCSRQDPSSTSPAPPAPDVQALPAPPASSSPAHAVRFSVVPAWRYPCSWLLRETTLPQPMIVMAAAAPPAATMAASRGSQWRRGAPPQVGNTAAMSGCQRLLPCLAAMSGCHVWLSGLAEARGGAGAHSPSFPGSTIMPDSCKQKHPALATQLSSAVRPGIQCHPHRCQPQSQRAASARPCHITHRSQEPSGHLARQPVAPQVEWPFDQGCGVANTAPG